MIVKNDIITLEDGDEYIVLKITTINNKQYAYIVNIKNKKDDGFVIIEDKNLKLIDDQDLIKKLIDLFSNVK